MGRQCGLDERKRPVNWKELGPRGLNSNQMMMGLEEGHPRQFQTDRRTKVWRQQERSGGLPGIIQSWGPCWGA